MPTLLLAGVLAAFLAVFCARAHRRERALTARVAALAASVEDLQRRVDAAEADVAHAVTQAEIAESLLLEKGVADEEDVEAVRRRFGDAPPGQPGDAPGHDGELH